MEPIWIKSYPTGVPAKVNVDEYRSLCDVFDTSARKFAAQPAFVNMGTAITYAQLDRLSGWFGAYLQYVLKLPRGARVALMLPNLLQYPVAMFGALRSGYTVVNCNPLYSPRELEYQLNDFRRGSNCRDREFCSRAGRGRRENKGQACHYDPTR